MLGAKSLEGAALQVIITFIIVTAIVILASGKSEAKVKRFIQGIAILTVGIQYSTILEAAMTQLEQAKPQQVMMV